MWNAGGGGGPKSFLFPTGPVRSAVSVCESPTVYSSDSLTLRLKTKRWRGSAAFKTAQRKFVRLHRPH